MNHVFLSYASTDRERAGALAHLLEARGFTVWWDRVIPPGRAYDDVIEEALVSAACMAVLWSHPSGGSQWVRIEASEALRRQRLVPAVIDEGATIARIQARAGGRSEPVAIGCGVGRVRPVLRRTGVARRQPAAGATGPATSAGTRVSRTPAANAAGLA